jgi:hypothetical protein
MSQTMGICAIIPHGQKGFQPRVFGMGIFVRAAEVLTCAHVVDATLGLGGIKPTDQARIDVCFPFAEELCIDGTVDTTRWFPVTARRNQSDMAVIRLAEPVPSEIERAVLKHHDITNTRDQLLKIYGFPSKSFDDGSWISHSLGKAAEGRIVAPLPGGRGQFVGLPVTGAAVQRGFSGAGVYDPNQNAIVGMIVEADRDPDTRVAQFIDVPSLQRALGPRRDRPSTVVVEPPVMEKAGKNPEEIVIESYDAVVKALEGWREWLGLKAQHPLQTVVDTLAERGIVDKGISALFSKLLLLRNGLIFGLVRPKISDADAADYSTQAKLLTDVLRKNLPTSIEIASGRRSGDVHARECAA